jgi:hypothetical protein
MELKHKKPCKECPWRKNSAKGWLGNSTPEQFVQQLHQGAKLPCHLGVDYEDPAWQDKLEDAPYCAGALAAMDKICKLPHDREHVAAMNEVCAEVDPDEILSAFGEFQEHHNSAPAKSWELARMVGVEEREE